MQFSRDALARLADWESAFDGFDRDGPRTAGSAIHAAMATFTRVLGLQQISCYTFQDGGLSNYGAVFCSSVEIPSWSTKPTTRTVINGSTVYFSLLAPYAVLGHAIFVTTGAGRSDPFIGLREVICPTQPATRIDRVVADAILETPYTLLSPADVSTKLPEGIVPFEYCFDETPWDCVFHVMFANTD